MLGFIDALANRRPSPSLAGFCMSGVRSLMTARLALVALVFGVSARAPIERGDPPIVI